MMKQILIAAALFCAPFVLIAQQPKPDTIPLNAEASKALVELAAEQNRCEQSVAEKQEYIFKGAGVPKDMRHCTQGSDGIVRCGKAPEAAKATPR